ncbi:MAG: hypothetical protein ACRES3_11495, partial [Steroidobacteraceae bacterium]
SWTFRELLRRASVAARDAISHAELPLSVVLEAQTRDRGGEGPFEVMVAYQQPRPEYPEQLACLALGVNGRLELHGLPITVVPVRPIHTQCELTWNVAEVAGEPTWWMSTACRQV